WLERNSPTETCNGFLRSLRTKKRGCSIEVSERVAGRPRDGFVETRHRIRETSERSKSDAMIVVRRHVVRVELERKVKLLLAPFDRSVLHIKHAQPVHGLELMRIEPEHGKVSLLCCAQLSLLVESESAFQFLTGVGQ